MQLFVVAVAVAALVSCGAEVVVTRNRVFHSDGGVVEFASDGAVKIGVRERGLGGKWRWGVTSLRRVLCRVFILARKELVMQATLGLLQ
jgi:hypothetical protein